MTQSKYIGVLNLEHLETEIIENLNFSSSGFSLIYDIQQKLTRIIATKTILVCISDPHCI